ncbi:MAG TPA: hypothetical protein VGR26_14815 [Acidimicrobiales bacterium]|nr:hypothetical protein [Acidimicrobiales bacterium]
MTDLAVPDQHSGELSPTEERENRALWKLACRYAKSTLVPKELQDDPDSVMYLLSYGRSLGLAPAHAVTGLWIIQGRVEPSAQVRVGVAMARGHEVLTKVTSSERCTIAVRRHGSDVWQEVTYTIDDARRAGALDTYVELWRETQSGKRYKAATYYVSCQCGRHESPQPAPDWARQQIEEGKVKAKEPWMAHPDDMLWAAAARRATKRFTPDSFLNIDLPDDDPAADFAVHPGDLPGAEVHEQHGAVEGPEPDPDIADAEVVEPEPAADARNRASQAEAAAGSEGGRPVPPAQSPPEPFPDTEPLAGPAFSRGFAIACSEIGIEDDGRHALIAYATGGRTRTSKEVRRGQEAAACFAALEGVKEDRLTWSAVGDDLVVIEKEAQA